MPTSLAAAQHLEAIEAGVDRMLDAHGRAGGTAPVPTCPAWTADRLLAHQAMVHRWAAANVRGEGSATPISQTRILSEVTDLRGYLREGADALVTALRQSHDDVMAMVFLKDAPPPRQFWARRQAHETTIHAVDALAAALGRLPTAAEADLSTELAVDGIDELLLGFLTRGRKAGALYDGEEFRFVVRPTDADVTWTLHVSDGPLIGGRGRDCDGDATLTGTAAQLYLGLWNRGAEITESGAREILRRFKSVRVRWS